MRLCLAAFAGLAITAAAQAQFSTGFEPAAYSGSAAGTLLTNGFGGPAGQDNWYNPVAGSEDFNVHTYAGNALGFPTNPNGGTQFIGALGVAATPIGRAQHNQNFSAGGTWTASWDVVGGYRGTSGTAVENLGSWSIQPSTTADYFQQIMQWGAHNTNPVAYDINFGVFAAAPAGITFQSPGAAFTNIPTDHWVHQSTTWNFTSNQILSVSIQDITGGGPLTTIDVSGNGWYLAGGQNNALGLALPTDIRCFTGNTDNATGWDNVRVVPAPSVIALLGLGGLVAGRRRR